MRGRYGIREVWWATAAAVVTVLIAVWVLPGRSDPPARPLAAAGPTSPTVLGECPDEGCTNQPVTATAEPADTAASSPAAGPPSSLPTLLPRKPTPGGFSHPGVLVSLPQLDFVRGRIAAGAQPWVSAFTAMRADLYASLSWVPTPRAVVDCGPGSQPNNGCTDERRDAMASYTDALMWYLTGDSRYAVKAIAIFDAWATVITSHTNSNAPIQAGWSGSTFARAGELIRYTYAGWSASQRGRFAAMLAKVYLPTVLPGEKRSNGNHELIELDAASGIAVFLDDRAAFNQAIAGWRARIPAYLYLHTDGPLPRAPAGTTISGAADIIHYWQGQPTFADGLAQETCRDFGHTGWGLEAATHVAATAWIQGIDLYAEMRSRITAALEFHATYDLGNPVPAWLCGGTVHTGLGPVVEMAYNHYHNRLGIALPNTARLVTKGRPAGTNYFIAWETLTNADNPYA